MVKHLGLPTISHERPHSLRPHVKLALVRQRYSPYGGAERITEQALAALAAAGVEVEIVARAWQGKIRGLRCDPFYLGRTWRDASFAHGVQALIASGRYDLVQSHERIPGCHVYRAGDGVHATWLELADKPWRLSPWHRYTLAAEDALFRHPSLRVVICNSRMVAEDITRRWPEAAAKIEVIYNGVDLARYHPGLATEHRALRARVGARETARIVLFVGSGYARKGVATLIEALAHLPPSIEAWIVGKDKDEAAYRRLAARFALEKRVRFFGAQADVRPFYGAADVFCLPTLYDPFPNAVLEALACGLPVVTTTTCGAAELLTPPETETKAQPPAGRIVPPADPRALAAALDELLAGAEIRREAARALVAPLSIDAMTRKLLTLYARLGLLAPAPTV